MKKIFKAIYWNLFLRYQAFRWVFKTNLGNKVIHNGEKYTIINGVTSGMWKIANNTVTIEVPRKECKYVVSLKNITHSYKSGVCFYKTNWLDIWKRNGFKEWMRCAIK